MKSMHKNVVKNRRKNRLRNRDEKNRKRNLACSRVSFIVGSQKEIANLFRVFDLL
jgi:hypothetical protein